MPDEISFKLGRITGHHEGETEGTLAERARIRQEFAAWFWSKASQDERVEDFMAALDRICPAGPEEG